MINENHRVSLWHGQLLHGLCLSVLLIISWFAWSALGKPQAMAFWTAMALPITHQVFVWLAWRLELRSSLISRGIGFQGYLVLFFILFASRFVSLFVLGWLDQGSLGMSSVPQAILTLIFLALGAYSIYSVKRYFGMARAAGADHFDASYQTMPLVKEGMFRFTNNAMYLYAFLLFWAIAIGFDSTAALIVAAFSHAYIWVHYYCTEKPDMDFIYGEHFGP